MKKIVNSVKTTSKLGRIGWSITSYVMDGERAIVDRTVPIVYCAGATSEAEALAMIAGAGKTTFAQETSTVNESTGEVSKFINYSYGNLKVMDVSSLINVAGKSRADRLAALLASGAMDNASGLNPVEKALRIKELEAIKPAQRTAAQKKELLELTA